MQKIRGKCIIFDLDQCVLQSRAENKELEAKILSDPSLLAIRSRFYQINIPDYRMEKGSGTRLHMWGVTRPHFREFLLFCRSYFDCICVWSAGTADYVNAIVSEIFDDVRKPDLVFTRDDIVYVDSKNYHKPIQKILSHPSIADRVDISHAFFVDDMADNFITSPGNGVVIPGYEPAPTVSSLLSDDICFLQLKNWLLSPKVAQCDDVRTLDKTSIFTTSVIRLTPTLTYNKDPVRTPNPSFSSLISVY